MASKKVYLIATDGDLVDRVVADLQSLGIETAVVTDRLETALKSDAADLSPMAVIYDRAAVLIPATKTLAEQLLARANIPVLNLVDKHTPPPSIGINLSKAVMDAWTLGAALKYAGGDTGAAWLLAGMANLGDAVVVANGAGRLQFMNRTAHLMTGYDEPPPTDAPVETFLDLRDSHQQEIAARLVGEAAARGLPVSAGDDISLIKHNGERIDVQANFSPISAPWAPMPGVVITLRDVTERRRADLERKRLVQRLTEANSEMERFVYTISHDLKSPLVTIGGFAGMLAKDIERANHDRIDDDLAEIRKATVHMQALVDGLLQLSRAGRVVGEPVSVSLADILGKVLTGLRAPIRTYRAQIEVMPDLPSVTVDPLRFSQVFEILIDNALKYQIPGVTPLIKIGCRAVGGELRIFVADNGPGIPARDRVRVFSLFERGDTHAEGTGIGLAIARRVVEAHEGRIWAEAGRESGTTFWIALPDSGTVK